MSEPTAPRVVSDAALESAKTLAQVVYALQAAAFLVGVTFLAAAIVNYLKLDDVRGTWIEAHFRWQLRTFWFGLLWACVGLVLTLVLIGWLVLFANMCWVIYRIVKGWVRLLDGRPPYDEPVQAG